MKWSGLRFALSRWGAVIAVIAVTAAVGGVAAVISYAHQHALNLAHEVEATAWTARFWPVTVEGIVLAAGLVLVIRRRAGRPGGLIVWSAMLVGAAVTLAANVASAPIDPLTGDPDRTSQLMNAWPPLAFLFAVELLVIAFRPDAALAEASLTPEEISDAAEAAGVAQVRLIDGGPDRPTHLYRLYDAAEALLYVGITWDLTERFRKHRGRQSWWSEVARVGLTTYATRVDAVLAEVNAIRTEEPRYNTLPGGVRLDPWASEPESGYVPDPPLADHAVRPLDESELSDEELGERLVKWAATERSMPSRERVRVRFGIGTERAARIRTAVLAASQTRQGGESDPDTDDTDAAVRVPELSEQAKRAAERPTNGSGHV